MMAKYVGPLTMDLVEYYLSLQTVTSGVVGAEELSDLDLFHLAKDQWSMVQKSLSALVYRPELIQNLWVSAFAVIGRFPDRWDGRGRSCNKDYLGEIANFDTFP